MNTLVTMPPPEMVLLSCLGAAMLIAALFWDDMKAAWRGLREWWWL